MRVVSSHAYNLPGHVPLPKGESVLSEDLPPPAKKYLGNLIKAGVVKVLDVSGASADERRWRELSDMERAARDAEARFRKAANDADAELAAKRAELDELDALLASKRAEAASDTPEASDASASEPSASGDAPTAPQPEDDGLPKRRRAKE